MAVLAGHANYSMAELDWWRKVTGCCSVNVPVIALLPESLISCDYGFYNNAHYINHKSMSDHSLSAETGKGPHRHGNENLCIPSLDGIRAVSVLVVVLSHAGYGHAIPGGLGVTIFFFLSGYLITTLLLNEYMAAGSINVGRFYARRMFRLAPPLLLVLIFAYALTLTGLLSGGATLTGFAAQLFYFANYYVLFFGGGPDVPSGTGILWSLSVEEHFYIIYPGLLLLLLRRLGLKAIAAIFVLLCVMVLEWRYQLTSTTRIDPNRTFYATDTRIDSILFGCILAILYNPMKDFEPRNISRGLGWVLMACGGSILVFTLLYRDEQFRESLRYTIQGIALMPIFFGAITMTDTYFFRALNSRVMRKIGVYSYCIYLSHYIIIYLLQLHLPLAQSRAVLVAATLVSSVAFAAFVDSAIDPYFRNLRRRYH